MVVGDIFDTESHHIKEYKGIEVKKKQNKNPPTSIIKLGGVVEKGPLVYGIEGYELVVDRMDCLAH